MEKSKISFKQNLIAATIGGLFTAFIVCPLDVLKTRIQAQPTESTSRQQQLLNHDSLYQRYESHLQHCENILKRGQPCTHFKISNTFITRQKEALSVIVKYEGVRALWKGLTPTLLMTIPGVTLYYSIYEKLLEKSNNPTLSGATARTISTFVTSPLEMFKTYAQSKKNLLSISQLLGSLYEVRGLKGFWTGFGATLMRDVPFSAIYWTIYESLGFYFYPPNFLNINNKRASRNRPFMANFLSGAIAGAVASIITIPADVVKTRQQMLIDSCKDENKNIPKIPIIIKSLYEAEGIKGFYRGVAPKVIRTAPACAIMISSYQFMRHFISSGE